VRLDPLPERAAWVHREARDGFEVLFTTTTPAGVRLRGHTTAVEDGVAWSVGYEVEVDHGWRTALATATAAGPDEDAMVVVERRRDDRWRVDGVRRSDLDGCVDVDFESSAATNTLPLHRLDLTTEALSVPAAFVRSDLSVQRMEQTYALLEETSDRIVVDYTSSTFDFACRMTYDRSGLVVDYPFIAVRHRV
jgi:hypothetical protein